MINIIIEFRNGVEMVIHHDPNGPGGTVELYREGDEKPFSRYRVGDSTMPTVPADLII